ncbi:MAG: hypothetical protein PHU85_03215 [Phycisphaerae bacterium]|nr:hypothetical protein [Phycisphaerae bacterium]
MLADGGFDLFFFWRRVLMIACTIYAIVRLAQSGYSWYVTLRGPGRQWSVARQYLLIQLLRVSPRRFFWELLDVAILSAIMVTLIVLHGPGRG